MSALSHIAGRSHPHGRGYTLVAVLILLAVMMLGLSVAGPLWSEQVRREREADLIRIGNLYAQALAAYHDATPGTVKLYPQRLDMLLSDDRHLVVRRYIRQIYPDPIDPTKPWGLVLDSQQRIVGVYSRSQAAPLAMAVGGGRYSDWKFLAKAKSQ